MLEVPAAVFTKLSSSKDFQSWQEEHSQSFLSHFFCVLDSEGLAKSKWEMGYFNPKKEKITIFVEDEGKFIIKPEDDVFKKPTEKVEKLELEKVKVDVKKAIKIWKENLTKFFPKETIGDGFLILQTYKGQTIWNFTSITRTLKFANIKIDVRNGEIASHQEINLIHKEK